MKPVRQFARCGVVIVLLTLGVCGACGPTTFTLEVEAGDRERRDVPLLWPLPAGVDPAKPWRLIRVEDGNRKGQEVPAQIIRGDPPSLAWIVRDVLPAGGTRRYRLEQAAPRTFPPVQCEDVGGKQLLLRAKGKEVLRYKVGTVQPPTGVDAIYARSGYIHPVRTPNGRVISNDFPNNHTHHHGIWFPWTKTEFEGRSVDFWNSSKGQGRVECVGVEKLFSGPVLAGFRARHRFIDMTAPGGEKVVLNETWDVKVYGLTSHFLFDLTSVQTCAGKSPLLLKEYRYGGLGFRGSGQWEGKGDGTGGVKSGVAFLTSAGKTRIDGHATSARWCIMSGPVDGEPAGIAFLGHPDNFRAPQRMRLHPKEPFFNFAPSQAGDFSIVPGKPYVSRYRFVVRDGPFAAAEADRCWYDYADPPRVRLVKPH